MIRTDSISVHLPAVPGSPKVSLSRNDSLSSISSGDRSAVGSPRISLHFDLNRRKEKMIRRALSESDILRSATEFPAKSRGVPPRYAGKWPESGIRVKELGLSGGNGGVNNSVTVDKGEQRKMRAYYEEMLKSNPSDPLLLRNYGKFLHEVEKDVVRGEEYYCRAILASPADGELLCLYGKLIWETQRDGERAKSYFDQAVSASHHDCMVLGSFANFMWEADEDEDDDEDEDLKHEIINMNNSNTDQVSSSSVPSLVPAF